MTYAKKNLIIFYTTINTLMKIEIYEPYGV
jgi:hypothetical protein